MAENLTFLGSVELQSANKVMYMYAPKKILQLWVVYFLKIWIVTKLLNHAAVVHGWSVH